MQAAESPFQRDAVRRLRRRREVANLAAQQAGILSRRRLYDLGVTRWEVMAELRADRWARHGRQSICVHRGPLPLQALQRVAVLEAGPRAFLDGASALVAAGLKNFTVDAIRVSVPRGARVYRTMRGVDIRQTRRWAPTDLASSSPPRARVEVAAVRAALWAQSNRQAALVLTMTVQQGLTTAERLGEELLRIRRDKRRALLHAVVLDLLGGARSLGELDAAKECRRRGLPEPSRQAMRRGRNGRYFLDLFWDDWNVVVEIDGIQHSWAQNIVGDAIRQNDLSLQGSTVLRLPLLGLRVAADDFFAQIEQALVDAGCPLRAAA